MKLGEVAARLRELANEYEDPELMELADEIPRRRPAKRAAPTSFPMTPALAAEIRAFCQQFPDWSQARVGRHFNVNAGRVSEVLNGKRT